MPLHIVFPFMKTQLPHSLLEFQQLFPNEPECAAYLEAIRWPNGFTCPVCGVGDKPQRIATRPRVLRCRHCHKDRSLTAGTLMHGTEISLQAWFLGAYLVTTQTPGMSARQLQRQLGMSRYETAFQMLHKLRTGMVRPERDRIGGNWPVEVDEALIGGRLRFCHIVNREAQTLTGFVKDNVRKGAWVRTDGWGGYDSLAPEGYVHDAMIFDGDPEKDECPSPDDSHHILQPQDLVARNSP